MAYQAHTEHGYLLSEVVSALQKSIRRGDEYQAMYWAMEMCPKYEKYLWRRLCVIVNEDIGIANLQAMLLIPTQRDLYFEFREGGHDGPARLVLGNSILFMCRGPKSRIGDHFQCAVSQDLLHGITLPIPDYAYDKHTGKGNQMGRGMEHFRTEGAKLEPPSTVEDPYEDKAYGYWSGDFAKTTWGKRGKSGKEEAEQATLF